MIVPKGTVVKSVLDIVGACGHPKDSRYYCVEHDAFWGAADPRCQAVEQAIHDGIRLLTDCGARVLS